MIITFYALSLCLSECVKYVLKGRGTLRRLLYCAVHYESRSHRWSICMKLFQKVVYREMSENFEQTPTVGDQLDTSF